MSRRTRVKVCGITCREDAEAAIAFGADALGFNTWPGTKRYLDLENATEWIRELPPFVTRVALCVNASLDEALAVAHSPVVDLVQFHGDEDVAYCRKFGERSGKPFIKALRIQSAEDIEQVGMFPTPHVLIDAHVSGHYGGTGVPVDLELARVIRERLPTLRLVLAGGLKPENVAAAIRHVRPYAVDVSSGVEVTPGRKDPALIQAFIDAVRSSDQMPGESLNSQH